MSLDNHKPDCGCAPCAGKRGTEAQRKATAELEATRRDIAWMLVQQAGGPDAVLALARQHRDPARAVSLLKAAGFDVTNITSRWRAEAPAQFSSSGNPWGGDPRHDPGAIRLLNGYTETDGEGNQRYVPGSETAYVAKVAELAEEQAARKNQRAARDRVLWTDRTGQAVMEDQHAQPLHPQRSIVSREWESFPDHASTGTA